MRVLEAFENERGLVIAVGALTNLPVGKRLAAVVTREDGTTVSTFAYKEWLLRRDPRPLENEAFLLHGLKKDDVPLGSDVALEPAEFVLTKAHSATIAARLEALGWALAKEFRAEGDNEPYEYLFEWRSEGEPIYPA